MNILSPSILAADFTVLGDEINEVKKAGAKYLHFDVMDGHFVDNISFGPPVLKSVRKATDLTLDVHLMISNPYKYIEAFANAGADIINFHYEAVDNHMDIINKIKSMNKKVGITVKPKTDIEKIYPFLKHLDMVLIMSVEPGFGGQKFNAEMLVKAKTLRKHIDDNNLSVDIEMDGGINLDNVNTVIESGVNVVVAGSAVFEKGKTEHNAKRFMEILNKY